MTRPMTWLASRRWFSASFVLLVAALISTFLLGLPQLLLKRFYAGELQWSVFDQWHWPPPSSSMDYSWLHELGPLGRGAVIVDHVSFDLVLPLAYASFFSISIWHLARKLRGEDSRLRLLLLVPVGTGVSDVFENVGIVLMSTGYPAHWITWIASPVAGLTILKWVGFACSLLICLSLLLIIPVRAAMADRRRR